MLKVAFNIVFAFCLVSATIANAQEETSKVYNPEDEIKYKPDYFAYGNILRTHTPTDSNYFKHGFSFGIGSTLHKDKYFALRLSLGYASMKFDKDYFISDYRQDFKLADSVQVSFSAKDRHVLSIAPEIKITPFSASVISPYVVLGITGNFGLKTNVIKAETNHAEGLANFYVEYATNMDKYSAEEKPTILKEEGRLTNRSSFHYNVGIGADYFPIEHYGLFAEWKYSSEFLNYKTPKWTYSTFNFGLIVRY